MAAFTNKGALKGNGVTTETSVSWQMILAAVIIVVVTIIKIIIATTILSL